MIRAGAWCGVLAALLAACGGPDTPRRGATADRPDVPPAQREAEALGAEVFDLVDRAMDYRGSHRGRPATSLRQMGIDSLTPTMVRRVHVIGREPLITVAYRRREGREIVACRGDSGILEEAALNGGRFTLMCTATSGQERPITVGGAPEAP